MSSRSTSTSTVSLTSEPSPALAMASAAANSFLSFSAAVWLSGLAGDEGSECSGFSLPELSVMCVVCRLRHRAAPCTNQHNSRRGIRVRTSKAKLRLATGIGSRTAFQRCGHRRDRRSPPPLPCVPWAPLCHLHIAAAFSGIRWRRWLVLVDVRLRVAVTDAKGVMEWTLVVEGGGGGGGCGSFLPCAECAN